MLKKKIIAVALCALMTASAAVGCGQDAEVSDSGSSVAETTAPAEVDIMNYTAPEKGDTIIEMNIRDYGTVKIRLFPEYAEKGCENFIELAKKGYYDGLTFHRVIRDFMIQGGDPLGTGTGGESTWGGEFDGGTDAHLAHVTGALAYANSGSTATDGSQFYIVTGDQNVTDDTFSYYEQYGYSFSDSQKELYKKVGGAPFLDGSYTIFGQVIDGLDVVFKAQYVPTDANDKPLGDGIIIDSVKVTEYNGEDIKWYLSDYDYDDPTKQDVVNFTAPEVGETVVDMKIKDYGDVKIKFFPEYAPQAVENFITHAKEGYYDGLTFHRVIADFMIQGGDPNGNGTGGESIWGGQFDGGTYFNLIHAAGAIAYANSGSTATNGSQFYIVTGTTYDSALLKGSVSPSAETIYSTIGGTPSLDGGYTVFGQVYDGLDIIFKIQNVTTDGSDKPVEDVIIESMTVEEYDGSPLRWYITDYDDAEETSEEASEETTEEESAEAESTEEETTEEETTSEAE
ncbi:MAG: peptidylprolyl isomerase [Ruminococcus sp.]|nr:peptidylprolyl isomerase [Ruminococcus sp.]